MKKNFPKKSGATSDFDDETQLILEKTGALKKQDPVEPNGRKEPKKKKNGKARKKWNLLKNMLLAFRMKRGESSQVSFKFKLKLNVSNSSQVGHIIL